ncbi:acyltransferase family protein [Xenorhabdus doucetiae]|uniref:Fucose 4-O-acetylase-like acetyltransferase n=1 Tax=Xenorhabdus doucetiae TaxID=351671 RepID=A0ABY3NSG6_9GAMM|nr:acyltransferase family protein [Xenorhabdus doucetiae]TYP07814.1 fucose 4-O-acetylase-like acetyltransferase [Xenorhabdus doucetiae]
MSIEKRVKWIDALKFIAIFWIWIGHFGDNGKQLYPFVFSFHVPLFFFISGIFFRECYTLKSLLGVISSSFKNIVIPYFIFSLISLVFFSLYYNSSFIQAREMASQIIPGIRNHIFAASLWFLPCLFIIISTYSSLFFIIKNKFVILLIFFCLFLASSKFGIGFSPKIFFNIDSAALYIIYYAIGAYFSNFILKFDIKKLPNSRKTICYVIMVGSIALFINAYFFGASYIYSGFKNDYIKIILSLLITLILFIPNIIASRYITFTPIITLGKSTLVLCGTEQLIKTVTYSSFKMFGLDIYLHNPIDTIVYTILCLLISYFTVVKVYRHIKDR